MKQFNFKKKYLHYEKGYKTEYLLLEFKPSKHLEYVRYKYSHMKRFENELIFEVNLWLTHTHETKWYMEVTPLGLALFGYD